MWTRHGRCTAGSASLAAGAADVLQITLRKTFGQKECKAFLPLSRGFSGSTRAEDGKAQQHGWTDWLRQQQKDGCEIGIKWQALADSAEYGLPKVNTTPKNEILAILNPTNNSRQLTTLICRDTVGYTTDDSLKVGERILDFWSIACDDKFANTFVMP
jgi:hypothetical protein